MHKARYCFTISVRPFVHHVVVLYLITEGKYRQTFFTHFTAWGIILVFEPPLPLQNFKGNSPSWSVKYTGVGKICDFRPKSPSISETIGERSVTYG